MARRERHQITASNTFWAFVSSSKETRHLNDIIFAIDVLRKRGVPAHSVAVFVDHTSSGPHFRPYGITNTFPLAELGYRLSQARGYESLMVTVTGHGNVRGLGTSDAAFSPAELTAAVRAMPGITTGVVILSQCFGGVFNLTDARTSPSLVLMGAANLNPSVSTTITTSTAIAQTNGQPGLQTWMANVFMLEFFQWLRSPSDVDGDGDLSILDGYKYAGAACGENLRRVKSRLFMAARREAAAYERLEWEKAPPHILDAQGVKLQLLLETLHNHQEPWILHADLSRKICV